MRIADGILLARPAVELKAKYCSLAGIAALMWRNPRGFFPDAKIQSVMARADSDVRAFFIDSLYRYPIPVDAHTSAWANALAAAKLDSDLMPLARAARQMMSKCHSTTPMPWPLRKPPEPPLRAVQYEFPETAQD
jgi:hypothetical protein